MILHWASSGARAYWVCSSGFGLADAFVFQSGRLFGAAPGSSVAGFPIALATMAIALSLVGLLIAHFGFIPLIAKAWKVTSKYFVVTIPIFSILTVVEVMLPGILPYPSIALISSSHLTVVAMGISVAGLLLGYSLRARSLLAISRATLVCSLVAIVIAKSSLLYEQNHQDIWLSLVQDWKVRLLIRVSVLITVGLGVAIALWGANSSFGRTQKAGVGHALVFFS